ncbi:dihydrodipicolinate synthase family protein [Cohnella sp. GCM10020058]|uniref:dihydrodipicolinate synthase family protein n=1 Tax=Cohnella sp. GCM10020058 TaxID=3317330 RepID=UPI00362EDBF6
MREQLPNGVWPVMLTPFTEDNEVDYAALERLVEWYIDKGADGLFAVCLSSEMFHLSLRERVEISRFVVKTAAGRIPVVASGHVSESIGEQLDEIGKIAGTGVDAVVLVTNRLASEQEDEAAWKRNVERVLAAYPDVRFGLYECPLPYQRLLSPALLNWCAKTGRFTFMKECSNDLEVIKRKIEAVQGTNLKVFIANNPHVMETMQAGGNGYSGILANFQPELYVWLTRHWRRYPEQAQVVQDYLGASNLFEGRHYPTSSKYYLQLEGLPATLKCRNRKESDFKITHRREIEQLHRFNRYLLNEIATKTNDGQ